MLGQGLRFAASGGFVTLVYVATTSLLAEVLGVEFQVSLASGFTLALTTHFTLQRFFVWTHGPGFALALRHQLARYLALAALQYGTTVVVTRFLPRALHVPTEVVYLGTAAVLSCATFLLFRSRVFHPLEQQALG
jgi:putative flippase GtrA